MIKRNYIVFAIITVSTTVWWFYQNTTDDWLIDGIFVSSITVTVVIAITSTITWLLLSWASAGSKNNVKVITYQNLFMGILSGYIAAAYHSGWVGPMAGIIIGILSSALFYGAFSIKRKIFN